MLWKLLQVFVPAIAALAGVALAFRIHQENKAREDAQIERERAKEAARGRAVALAWRAAIASLDDRLQRAIVDMTLHAGVEDTFRFGIFKGLLPAPNLSGLRNSNYAVPMIFSEQMSLTSELGWETAAKVYAMQVAYTDFEEEFKAAEEKLGGDISEDDRHAKLDSIMKAVLRSLSVYRDAVREARTAIDGMATGNSASA